MDYPFTPTPKMDCTIHVACQHQPSPEPTDHPPIYRHLDKVKRKKKPLGSDDVREGICYDTTKGKETVSQKEKKNTIWPPTLTRPVQFFSQLSLPPTPPLNPPLLAGSFPTDRRTSSAIMPAPLWWGAAIPRLVSSPFPFSLVPARLLPKAPVSFLNFQPFCGRSCPPCSTPPPRAHGSGGT